MGSTASRHRPFEVLYVEDHAEQAALTLAHLSGTPDFRIHWAKNLMDAIQYLSGHVVDVVLLDLGMPELEGPGCHTAIQAVRPGVPVVVLTADERESTRARILSRGTSNYLVKQRCTPGLVQASLRNAIRAGTGNRHDPV